MKEAPPGWLLERVISGDTNAERKALGDRVWVALCSAALLTDADWVVENGDALADNVRIGNVEGLAVLGAVIVPVEVTLEEGDPLGVRSADLVALDVPDGVAAGLFVAEALEPGERSCVCD